MKVFLYFLVGSVVLALPTYAQQDSLVEHRLQEVVVVAKQPLMEVEAGKYVYRPDASITQGKGTVYDLLATLSGVAVSEDGVRLNGRAGVQVLLDGKSFYLSSRELMSLLRATPSTQVEKIEVITQPSARHEAEGTSGVIDIRLRKQKRQGMNLALNTNVGLGASGYGNGSLSTNWRKGKVNIYSTLFYYDGRQLIEMTIDRAAQQERMEQEAQQRRKNRSFYGRIGTDWNITSRTSWSLSLDGNAWRQHEQADMRTELSPQNEIENTESRSRPSRKHLTVSTSLEHRLPEERGEVSASLDYFRYRRAELQQIRSSRPSSVEGDMSGNILLFSGRVDAAYSINDRWKLSGGVKANRVQVNNRSDYMQTEKEGGLSESSYVENLRAAYFQSDYERSGLKGSFGLRLEQAEVNGHSDLHLFPSFFGQYSWKNDHTIQVSYTRRISRPGYDAQNSFVHVHDYYTYETGNPDLRPAFSDQVELGYARKGLLHASLFFSRTGDEILSHYRITEKWIACVSPHNFDFHLQGGIRLNISDFSFFPWCTANATAQLIYNHYRWDEDGEGRPGKGRFTPSAHILTQFTLSPLWKAECSVSAQGRQVVGQAILRPIWEVRLGLQRKVFGGKGTLGLFVHDLFNSNFQCTELPISTLHTLLRIQENKRVVGVSFSWMIQKGLEAREKVRRQVLDEKKRINL